MASYVATVKLVIEATNEQRASDAAWKAAEKAVGGKVTDAKVERID